MVHRARHYASWMTVLVPVVFFVPAGAWAQARPIPGINADDPFPGGCVDCHIQYPEQDLDVRFSTLLALWEREVSPELLARSQAASEPGVTLQGMHPETKPDVIDDIPGSCVGCHRRRSDEAPILSRLVHLTHLAGGADNIFMTDFKGDCTLCHKLDLKTGAWSMPSGPEHAGN
jgi:hypothetical protein